MKVSQRKDNQWYPLAGYIINCASLENWLLDVAILMLLLTLKRAELFLVSLF